MVQTNLNDEHIAEFKDAFNQFDLEGRGSITTKELGPFLKSMGQSYSDKEIQEMIAEVDADEKGTVDFPEILSLLARKMKDSETDAEVKRAFKVFVRQGEEDISIEDLQRVMMNLGDKMTKEEINAIIREADEDENGTIDHDEFIKMMMAQ